jgi:tetratricopeptide (TPR) repeat protein
VSDSPIILGYDPETLRERIDADAATARLEEISKFRSLAALNEQVALLRMLGRLDEAFERAQTAARQSRFTGSREDSLAARVRRAQVTQYQGKLEAALGELTNCVEEAVAHDWAELAGFALQHRGKVLFELERYDEALADFERALKFRESDGIPADQKNSTKFAIRVVRAKLEGAGTPDEFDEPVTSINA